MATPPIIQKILSACLILLLFVINAYGDEDKGNIHIVIENLRNSKGWVRISLYRSKAGFPFDPRKALANHVTKITEDKAEALFENLPRGSYAVGALHDENGNGKLDFKWGIIPREGLGVSNNPEPGLTPPSFEDSKVTLEKGGINIKIKINY